MIEDNFLKNDITIGAQKMTTSESQSPLDVKLSQQEHEIERLMMALAKLSNKLNPITRLPDEAGPENGRAEPQIHASQVVHRLHNNNMSLDGATKLIDDLMDRIEV